MSQHKPACPLRAFCFTNGQIYSSINFVLPSDLVYKIILAFE